MNTVKTGGVQMVPIHGRFQVWTKRIGAGPTTMLTLHGGPGSTHEYFECFEDFPTEAEAEAFAERLRQTYPHLAEERP